MPELPEVETIRSQLSHYLPLRIKNVWQSDKIASIAHTPLDGLKGGKILQIFRRGKLLIIDLQKNQLLSHLGMTGAWRISEDQITEKHLHLQLECENTDKETLYLSYIDPRRFGHMYFYNLKEAKQKIEELGPDLTTMNAEQIKYALKKYPARAIKVTLLDQKLFAGSGNYIANEICARAKVLPQRTCETLTPKELNRFPTAISKVLDQSLKGGGTTFQGGYQDTTGNKGEGVSNLVVFYQKICQQCKVTPVEKITLAQRGTYFCPKCQQ